MSSYQGFIIPSHQILVVSLERHIYDAALGCIGWLRDAASSKATMGRSLVSEFSEFARATPTLFRLIMM